MSKLLAGSFVLMQAKHYFHNGKLSSGPKILANSSCFTARVAIAAFEDQSQTWSSSGWLEMGDMLTVRISAMRSFAYPLLLASRTVAYAQRLNSKHACKKTRLHALTI
jgi:hypothetical protein